MPHSQTRPRGVVLAGVGVVLALVTIVLAFALPFSFNRVAANEWGCLYGGGLGEKKALKTTIAPGTSGGFTYGDTLETLPYSDRIYAIDEDPNTADFGGTPIVVPAKGTAEGGNGIVPVVVPIQVRFTINERACDLFNNYLKGRGDPDWNGDNSTPGAWPNLLNIQLNQQIIAAVRAQLSGISYITLYTDFGKYPEYQTAVAKALGTSLKSSLGDEYFCGPSYSFDGEADGVVENCPPVEVTIKEIKPQDGQYLANLETIVRNQEQQTVIESEKDKAIKESNAARERAVAEAQNAEQTKLAQTESEKNQELARLAAEQETEAARIETERTNKLAAAAADVEIARAFAQVVAVETENELVRKRVETAFCERLAAVGVNCVEYFKYQNYNPSVVLAEDSVPLVQVGG